ncbi:hypothetical protein [Streptomyces sp. NPDC094032]|uniref:hypothetical protein n=1 Tax=Streptomyces sp. NPDC094032 TaxID=3155308 RepID=UPI00332B9630
MSARNGEPSGCSRAAERTIRTRYRGSATYVPEPARPSNTLADSRAASLGGRTLWAVVRKLVPATGDVLRPDHQ